MYPICAAEEKATIVVSLRAAMAETEPATMPHTPRIRRMFWMPEAAKTSIPTA